MENSDPGSGMNFPDPQHFDNRDEKRQQRRIKIKHNGKKMLKKRWLLYVKETWGGEDYSEKFSAVLGHCEDALLSDTCVSSEKDIRIIEIINNIYTFWEKS